MALPRLAPLLATLLYGAVSLQGGEFAKKEPAHPQFNATAPALDINLGESPADFAAACWLQLKGAPLSEAGRQAWAAKLGTPEAPRRIDLALLMAKEARVSPRILYSDPWQEQVPLEGAPARKVKRQIGAVMMFFFECPNPLNGSVHWCNNHVAGMELPSPIYGFGDQDKGYYNPRNPGFWYREFKDAEYAGLGFLMPNMYGPDWKPAITAALKQGWQKVKSEDGDAAPRFALFDDTWTWGKPYYGDFWKQIPNVSKPEEAARLIYENKWKKFFATIPKEAWFTIAGRPLVYFYNAGTLVPLAKTAPVIEKMKQLFKADFGVEPFVAVDVAFFNDPGTPQVADAKFRWMTFDLPGGVSLETIKGLTLAHAMLRWDPTTRDNDYKERIATPGDKLVKDDQRLINVLNATRDDDYLVLATWNDLGEGTGLNRSYDYYWNGAWKTPDHFMRLIRRSQEGETLPK